MKNNGAENLFIEYERCYEFADVSRKVLIQNLANFLKLTFPGGLESREIESICMATINLFPCYRKVDYHKCFFTETII